MTLIDDLILLHDIQESLFILEKTPMDIITNTLIKLRRNHLEKIFNNDLMKTSNLLDDLRLIIPDKKEEKIINKTKIYYSENK
jgi:hypothetical protein